jgi:hypothetical protein
MLPAQIISFWSWNINQSTLVVSPPFQQTQTQQHLLLLPISNTVICELLPGMEN